MLPRCQTSTGQSSKRSICRSELDQYMGNTYDSASHDDDLTVTDGAHTAGSEGRYGERLYLRFELED